MGFFSETPPFNRIFKVQWGGYRLTGFLQTQKGVVTHIADWVGAKKYYTQGELTELKVNGQKTQVPQFGSPTYSLPTEPHELFPDVPLPPGVFIDAHGYTAVTGAAGTKMYFDYNGQRISEKDIPVFTSVRGWPVASDLIKTDRDREDKTLGTVYFYHVNGATGGALFHLTKYSRLTNGILWDISSTTHMPETVVYQEDSGRLALVYSALPDEIDDPGGVMYYNMSGQFLSKWTLPTAFGGHPTDVLDISRDGKLYTSAASSDEDFYPDISCYSVDGAQLWEIPGETVFDGWAEGGTTAYGEDYVVIVYVQHDDEIVGLDDGDPSTPIGFYAHITRLHSKYKVHDALTGAVVSEATTGTTTHISVTNDSNEVTTSETTEYGHNSGFVRSNYWPRLPK